eukprot:gnl/MRDRNA2_/MRDRNA2_70590_c0_seq1.p1 gnl/MRDRNA2_/MRDRNA2_70590_c0~~gnl/MRDRNA2_/MRDRNA2_70590_c0_seq1.p1  ORF type:complete len:363 (+),score=93.53 gnl/MRDRNA2_/MRDRNA2_70590_c0_seq1:46-1134(+)
MSAHTPRPPKGKLPQLEEGGRPPIYGDGIVSGPGQVRDFGQNSKFQTKDSAFTMGKVRDPKTAWTTASENDEAKSREAPFTTVDISRQNERKHKWNRMDTFHTPHGHLRDARCICVDKLRTELKGSISETEISLTNKIDTECAAILREIQGYKSEQVDLKASFKQVLDAIAQLSSQVGNSKSSECDPNALLTVIDKIEEGFSKVENSVKDVQPWVDLTSVTNELTKIEDSIAKIDVSPNVDLGSLEWSLGQIEENMKCPQIDPMMKAKLEVIEDALGKLKQPEQIDHSPGTHELTELLGSVLGQVEAKVLAELNPLNESIKEVGTNVMKVDDQLNKELTPLANTIANLNDSMQIICKDAVAG